MQINSQFLKVTCIKKLFSKVAGFSWYLLKLEKKDIWLENFFAESIFSKNGQFQKIEISFDFSLLSLILTSSLSLTLWFTLSLTLSLTLSFTLSGNFNFRDWFAKVIVTAEYKLSQFFWNSWFLIKFVLIFSFYFSLGLIFLP